MRSRASVCTRGGGKKPIAVRDPCRWQPYLLLVAAAALVLLAPSAPPPHLEVHSDNASLPPRHSSAPPAPPSPPAHSEVRSDNVSLPLRFDGEAREERVNIPKVEEAAPAPAGLEIVHSRNGKVLKPHRQIHGSAALYGAESTMIRVLDDVTRFLQPDLVVVHVSAGSRIDPARLAVRQLLNPESLRVRHVGPSILSVHLRNVAVLERHLALRENRTALDSSGDKVVFIAANQRYFRPCREYVMRHDLSFSLGQTTDYRPSHGQAFKLPVRFPSSEWRELLRRVNRSDDWFIQRNTFHRHFVMFMHNTSSVAAAEGWARAPISYMPHEGSFYPLWLLRHFMISMDNRSRVLNPFASPSGACGWPCNWPEEQLLPTWIWQRHLGLLRSGRVGPPVVVRAWFGDRRKAPRTASAALALINQTDPALRYVCALKLANHQIYALNEV